MDKHFYQTHLHFLHFFKHKNTPFSMSAIPGGNSHRCHLSSSLHERGVRGEVVAVPLQKIAGTMPRRRPFGITKMKAWLFFPSRIPKMVLKNHHFYAYSNRKYILKLLFYHWHISLIGVYPYVICHSHCKSNLALNVT